MKPNAEKKDLAERPLPVQPATIQDTHIPSRLYDLAIEISSLKAALDERTEEYAIGIQRAIELDILDEGIFHIVRHEKNKPRVINLNAFSEKHPNEFAMAQRIEVNDKINAVIKGLDAINPLNVQDVKIKTVQSLLAERIVDEVCYPHEVTVTWTVERIPKLKRGE